MSESDHESDHESGHAPHEPEAPPRLTRREAIERVAWLLGGTALVGHGAMLAGCATSGEPRQGVAPSARAGADLFTRDEIALLDEVADTILPETSTPGAKAAGVGPFIALMVADTYTAADRQVFRQGLVELENASSAAHGTPFVTSTAAQRHALLERLDAEQHAYMQRREAGAPAHYFRMLKELTLLGYFTSEIGYAQAMRYIETPGRYDPCLPHAPGDRIWASHA